MALGDLARCLSRLERLEDRGLITTNPSEAEKCCGHERDDDGFCQHRPHHPAYVPKPF